MHYFMCLHLDQFYVADACATQPEVVFRDKFILDSNTAARRKNVRPGMPLSQGKALLDGADFTEWTADHFKEKQEKWLSKLPKYSGIIEPADQHIAFVDLSAHPQPEKIAPLILDDLKEYGVRWGAAQSKWLAQLAMRFDAADIPVTKPHLLLEHLPTAELDPILPEHRERLEFLGYTRVGSIRAIPGSVLFSQFGKESIRIAAAARGDLHDPVLPVYPPATHQVHFRFDGGVSDSEILAAGLKELAKLAGRYLSDHESQALEFRLVVETESGFLVLTRPVQKPLNTTMVCLSTLGMLPINEIKDPIVSFRLILEKLEKRPRVQKELNYHVLSDSQVERASKQRLIQQTVALVQKSHGLDALKLASQIVTPREQRVIKQWEVALGIRHA